MLQYQSPLNLNKTYTDFCKIIKGTSLTGEATLIVDQIVYDTRKIVQESNTVFFALSGEFRDGHTFVESAYSKGIRIFVVSKSVELDKFPEAHFIEVKDCLFALQDLAHAHRIQFNFPLIAITGSAGKTTVKEWLYHLLSPSLRVTRSPKSYNSQLGVALSLLELHPECDVAIIEVGISKPGEMARLAEIVQPTIGVFTSFGRSHEENFKTIDAHLSEKLSLFFTVQKTFYPNSIQLTFEQNKKINGVCLKPENYKKELAMVPFDDLASRSNALVAIALAKLFLEDTKVLKERISSLPQLALRMETFEGINSNTIINDTYNLDLDALNHSLEYQIRVANNRKRIVIIGLDEDNYFRKEEVEKIVKAYEPDQLFIIRNNEKLKASFENAVVLIKGTRKADMQRLAKQFRLKNHKTFVEIDLTGVRRNIAQFKSLLHPETKLLAMVKAQSYGSGVEKMAAFFEQQGIDYLGVAYADEGVELRKQGIKLPILVMNAEEDGFEDCINHQLEPAIYSFNQLDHFIKELIFQGQSAYPIHLKLDTGMRRLGFELKDIPRVCEILQAQPEIRVKSVYSHLADADNRRDKRFTEHQIKQFHQGTHLLNHHLNYHFDRHILNSEGIANYPNAQYEMVRLGIGMYGISSNPTFKQKLQPVLKWLSAISQIKELSKGESVGYNRAFIAEKLTKIAIIPVGYADGFRRNLSNGKGGVYIHETYCPTIGKVCMDMIMVDVTKLHVKEGDKVVIIGGKQTIEKFATQMDTIPYEVMTSISKRVHRVYLEE
ncbi:MAG: alanine racemase [Bacteroidota bacterium]